MASTTWCDGLGVILPPCQFQTFMRLIKAAGQHGMPMPKLVPGSMLSGEQMLLANTAYDQSRNEYRARTLKGRAR